MKASELAGYETRMREGQRLVEKIKALDYAMEAIRADDTHTVHVGVGNTTWTGGMALGATRDRADREILLSVGSFPRLPDELKRLIGEAVTRERQILAKELEKF